jgi:tetratricopeptide (TPR) repeat protein
MQGRTSAIILFSILAVVVITARGAQLTWGELVQASSVHWRAGDLSGAEDLIQRAIREAGRFGSADPRLAVTLNNYASIEQDLGKYVESERAFRRALDIWGSAPAFPTNRIHTLTNLACLYIDTSQLAKLRQIRQELAAAIDRNDLDANTRATLLDILGAIEYDSGHPENANGLYRQALETLGTEGAQTATAAAILNNIGLLSLAAGRPAEARGYIGKAWSIWYRLGLPDAIRGLMNLAILDCQMARFRDAEAEARQAVAGAEKLWGPEHVATAEALLLLAQADRGLKRKKDAARLERRAQNTLRKRASETGQGYTLDASELSLRTRF